MALSWAQSKVERFQDNPAGSSTLGPGDYDPCIPKSQGMAGAVSLGFTSSKGLTALDREEPIPEETEAVLSAARDRTAAVAASRRSSFGGPRPALNLGMSRLDKVKAEQQAKQLAWAETEREKLLEEVKTLRSLQVCMLCFTFCWYDTHTIRFGVLCFTYLYASINVSGRTQRARGKSKACITEVHRKIFDDCCTYAGKCVGTAVCGPALRRWRNFFFTTRNMCVCPPENCCILRSMYLLYVGRRTPAPRSQPLSVTYCCCIESKLVLIIQEQARHKPK